MGVFEKLLNRSYNFLSFRPRSEKEVRDYLLKKKSDEITTERIITSLKESKFLDDKEFTKWWIEQRSKIKPKSIKLIIFELKQKGITKEVIEDVLNDKDFVTVSDFDKALGLAQKRLTRTKNIDPKKKYERMARFLASKGFNWDVIKKVIDQVLPKGYNT